MSSKLFNYAFIKKRLIPLNISFLLELYPWTQTMFLSNLYLLSYILHTSYYHLIILNICHNIFIIIFNIIKVIYPCDVSSMTIYMCVYICIAIHLCTYIPINLIYGIYVISYMVSCHGIIHIPRSIYPSVYESRQIFQFCIR